MSEIDSDELAEWAAYDRRWPLPDSWQQTARMCRVVMAASGNYKRGDLPDESVFIPRAIKYGHAEAKIIAELQKLNAMKK